MSRADRPRCTCRHPQTRQQCKARVYHGNRWRLCHGHLVYVDGGLEFIQAETRRTLARIQDRAERIKAKTAELEARERARRDWWIKANERLHAAAMAQIGYNLDGTRIVREDRGQAG